MKPCYLDLHIHTSENANKLRSDYPLNGLLDQIERTAKGNDYLISLTDHNCINLDAYKKLKILSSSKPKLHFLIGAELSIRNYKRSSFYHCHFFFNYFDDLEGTINKLNKILDTLYPDKMPSDTCATIPQIQEILELLDDFEYLVLPHGGQSHRTFDGSIPKGAKFDTVLQRNIYYNVFDGFTARSNAGLEQTQNYFKRLGINDIINLITCTDNYDPKVYPKSKSLEDDFLPTWMYSSPSFSGLRLALSESSRLSYGLLPRDEWQENIGKVFLENDKIKIDVNLEPGLNVVIGNSSSGKTLFVDSIYRKLNPAAGPSDKYKAFLPENIQVQNISGTKPHFFSQNYILDILNKRNDDGTIDLSALDLIKDNFKLDAGTASLIESNLRLLEDNVSTLVDAADQIAQLKEKINAIPVFTRLLFKNGDITNPIELFAPKSEQIPKLTYTENSYKDDLRKIEEVEKIPGNIYFCESFSKEIGSIRDKLLSAYLESQFEATIRKEILEEKNTVEQNLEKISAREKEVKTSRDSLFALIPEYIRKLKTFFDALDALSKINLDVSSKEVVAAGHKLSIKNSLQISETNILEVFNACLKTPIASFKDFLPGCLNETNFRKKNPKINGFPELKERVTNDFIKENKTSYVILYKGKTPFDELSPGFKSSVILDIILSNQDDSAPLIIDQPEDNLSTNYINGGLIRNLKNAKARRQIITVSHNATIPMLGDAQNIIICQNENGKITITSHHMEDSYNGSPVTDLIANLTDGGKSSIKKRVKKYNLKDFKEEPINGNQD